MKERDGSIDELYGLRMDINKKINLLEDKNTQIEALSQRLTCETERAQKIIAQEREVGQLKSDIQTYMQILKQVLKHLKTLLKYLHDQVQTTRDPTVIEQTNRQIRSIEKLSSEVKTSMKAQIKRAPKDCQDTFFLMSASDICDSGEVTQRMSISKRQRTSERLTLMARESMHGNMAERSPPLKESSTSGQPMAAKRIKLAVASEARNLNTSQESGFVSASGVSVMTNQNMKTMVQTTDADSEHNHPLSLGVAPSKASKSAKGNENCGMGARRATKAHEKSKGKVLQSNSCAQNQLDEADMKDAFVSNKAVKAKGMKAIQKPESHLPEALV